MTTRETKASDDSWTESHALVAAEAVWQKLHSAVPPPQTPSIQAAAEKSWPGKLSLDRVEDIEALTVESGASGA